MTDAPKLKDYFTPAVIDELGGRIAAVHGAFDRDGFARAVLDDRWNERTFTERTRHISEMLWRGLDLDVTTALQVLVEALPEELDGSAGVLNERFWLWPIGDFIATYAEDEVDAGLDACYELTKRFTAEFAIRPLLAAHPEALDRVATWASDPNEHVRRLVSEGTRPRLPWATRLDLPTDTVLEILSQLRADPSPYVRKSVANHLNDLSKDDPDRIITLMEAWHAEDVAETTWIVRHALRNHLKDGQPRVLRLFGFNPPRVAVDSLSVDPAAANIGDAVELRFTLRGRGGETQRLMVDLVVGYVKASGAQAPKVFKCRELELAAGESIDCRRRLDLRQRSTRRLYPGTHAVTIRVNGEDLATAEFELLGGRD
ncbi:MAG: DNA alkylation repair protein [Microthrixaceae bacterium]